MTADSGTHGRRFAMTGAGLIVIALAAAGCADERRFSKEGATRDTKTLVVPTRITPPVTVARIEGAPKIWQLNARVAKALRDRDVPAGTEGRGKTSYTVTGRAERLAPADGSAAPRLRIAWTLHDAEGKPVGRALQVAVHPVAAGARLDADIDRKVDPVALDRLARVAAERLTPLVPHTAVNGGQATRAGDPQATRARDPMWRRVAGAPVTALGKQDVRQGGHGLSARFLKLRNVTTVAARNPEQRIAEKRQATRPQPAEKPASTAVVKPAQAEGSALTKHSVVTERIAFEAEAAAASAKPARAAPPRAAVTPVAATGRRSQRSEALRKDATIRPAPGTRKFPVAGAASGTKKIVQVAEAAGARDDGAPTGFWVQLASNPSPKASRAAWESLVAQHAELLERQPHAINRADLGPKGVYYRLQLGPYPNIAQAKRICASLRAARVPCLLMEARGQVASRGSAGRRVVTKPLTPAPKVETPKAPAKAKRKRAPDGGAEESTARREAGKGKAAAGKASAVRPSAGHPKTKPDPKSGERAAEASIGDGGKRAPKPGFGVRAEKPKTRADKLPFQRSKALPGLPD